MCVCVCVRIKRSITGCVYVCRTVAGRRRCINSERKVVCWVGLGWIPHDAKEAGQAGRSGAGQGGAPCRKAGAGGAFLR